MDKLIEEIKECLKDEWRRFMLRLSAMISVIFIVMIPRPHGLWSSVLMLAVFNSFSFVWLYERYRGINEEDE